ncbi:MAG: hypothetical protein QM607_03720 [Microbacterium sp.]
MSLSFAQTAAPPGRVRSATPVPLIVGAVSFLVSLVLTIWVATSLSAPVRLIGPLTLPLVTPDAWRWSLIGYLLTPFACIICLGLDILLQRGGLSRDPNFITRPVFGVVLRWMAIAGIVLGAWHALNLSVPISEWLAAA